MDVRLENNKVVEYRVRLTVSFKYHKELERLEGVRRAPGW